MRLQLVRNATLRLSYAGHEVLIDPFFAPKHSLPPFGGRERNPTADLPVTAERVVENVELAIVSHLHPDHFDETARDALPKSLSVLCQPGDEDTIRGAGFTDVTPLADRLTWRGLTIERTPGEHGTGKVGEAMGRVSGFVLRAEGEPTVYWAGDTVLCAAVLATLKRVKPDVVVTHSGGAVLQGTLIIMDAPQTLDLLRAAPGATVIATHLESLDHCLVTRAELRRAAREAGVPDERLLVPEDGEVLTIP